MHEHLQQLADALAAEEAHQRKELTHARSLPLGDQIALGVAWPTLKVEAAEPAGRGRSRWLLRGPAGALHDALGPGDVVDLLYGGGKLRGIISYADGGAAEVRVDSADDPPREVTVARAFDDVTFARYKAALEGAGDSRLARVLRGDAEPGPLPTSWTEPRCFAGLNDAQKLAGRHALQAEDIALIHGPPGTGKTRVLTAVLQALVESGETPWALADSNAAVDHLAVKAAEAGLNVVRVGQVLRMGDAAAALSMDARVAKHAMSAAIRTLDRDLARLRGQSGPAVWKERRTLREERDRLTAEAEASVLRDAQVVASTFGTLARLAPHLPRARTAVVDEATQAIEPAVWVAVPHVERLVLAGDPHQLGPVVMSPNNPLERGLLQRLVEEDRLPMPMLEVQHRMNARIQAMVRSVYGPSFRAHESVAGHVLAELPGVQSDVATTEPVLWIDTSGAGLDEQRCSLSRSLYQLGEIALVLAVVQRWRELGVPAEAIGVIAPYSAQVSRLKAEAALADIEVATVNAFQGREKEAIVASFVRSNPDGELGFVDDPRRLVVTLTRARRGFVGIGDASTLSHSALHREVLDGIDRVGALTSVWSPPWSAVLD